MDNYVGKRLDGRYEIQEIIGVGGMAIVYKAYDNIDDRMVSIKILKEEYLANEEFRRRFKNESKAIAVLSHPNIVKVYDVSFGDRLQYIVMEYVEGITLKEYIEQQKIINWKDAVHFTTQILRALQHAHDKGIIHRDIKPQNIMLLEDGTIKVTDFGIARFNRTDTKTMTASAIGSVHYISPEQARGEYTDAKADIYSVGVVLYEMITGRVPFESDNAVSVALMQVQEEAVPPRKLNGSIPAGVEQIVLHAMEKNPKNRYQSASEMILDLEDVYHDPSMRFDYQSYYVDSEPTIFVPKDAFNNAIHEAAKEDNAVKESKPVKRSEKVSAEDKKTAKLAALIGLIVLLLALLIFLIVKSGLFSAEKVTVPNFIGLNYTEEVLDNSEYSDFDIEVSYVTSTTAEEDEIVNQDPDAGTSVRAGSKITLEVATSGAVEEIPEVAGKTYDEAVALINKAGFKNVTQEKVYDLDHTAGTVLETKPAEGVQVATSELITIYVASDTSDEETTVPNVVDAQIDDAETLITSAGLKVGDTQEVDSNQAKGTVLEQGIKAGSKVTKGTTIDLIISNGAATGNFTFKLPDLDSSTETMVIYVNNEQVKSARVLCDGSKYSTTVAETGTSVPVEVRINDQTYYTATWNFSNGSPVATSETYKEVEASSNSGLFW